MNKETVTDIDGVTWIVRQSRPTRHGFDIKIGVVKNNPMTKRPSMILTESVARYLCRLVNFGHAGLPVSTYTLYRWVRLSQKRYPHLKPDAEVTTDVFGKPWYVTSSVRSRHGFTIKWGNPAGNPYKRGQNAVILTEDVARYLWSVSDVKKVDLPVKKYRLIKWRKDLAINPILLEPNIVTDYLGRRYLVRQIQPTPHGFDILRGQPLFKTNHITRAVILTDQLVKYLNDCPDLSLAELPIRLSTLYTWHQEHHVGNLPKSRALLPKAKKPRAASKAPRFNPSDASTSAAQSPHPEEWWKRHQPELRQMPAKMFSMVFDVPITLVEERKEALSDSASDIVTIDETQG